MIPVPERAALLTDLYQLTMAYGYWHAGKHEQAAAFNLFFRSAPFDGGYAITAGLHDVVAWLEDFRFQREEIEYLRELKGNDGQPLFSADFLRYLSSLRFTGDLWAMPEGTLAFPHEPIVRVQAPLIQAQLLETALLTLLNFPTLIATKAARVCQAAQGDAVLEFGLRRAQGVNGGLTASRAAYLGGCTGTSNVLAGQRYGIPVKGTHAHSWVMSFATESEAFAAYARALPNNCIFLIDTYDSLAGIKRAVEMGKQLREQGHQMVGIRLDSGDLLSLSLEARRLLDAAGLENASIVASNDLDEHLIHRLKASGARIDVWGVGTKLVTAYDQPALGGVYKLAALGNQDGTWQPKLKLSNDPGKVSNPGLQQVARYTREGEFIGDQIFHEPWGNQGEKISSFYGAGVPLAGAASELLLQPVIEQGRVKGTMPDLEQVRARVQEQLALLPEKYKRLIGAASYPVGLEPQLARLKQDLVKQTKAEQVG
mgnify:CR=1 FL=1